MCIINLRNISILNKQYYIVYYNITIYVIHVARCMCYWFISVDNVILRFQILKDNLKARREIRTHVIASQSPNVVSVIDVYENQYNREIKLFVVMEWLALQRPNTPPAFARAYNPPAIAFAPRVFATLPELL